MRGQPVAAVVRPDVDDVVATNTNSTSLTRRQMTDTTQGPPAGPAAIWPTALPVLRGRRRPQRGRRACAAQAASGIGAQRIDHGLSRTLRFKNYETLRSWAVAGSRTERTSRTWKSVLAAAGSAQRPFHRRLSRTTSSAADGRVAEPDGAAALPRNSQVTGSLADLERLSARHARASLRVGARARWHAVGEPRDRDRARTRSTT
jgi:hypothetical protein